MTLLTEPTRIVLAKDYIPVDPSFTNVSLLLHGNGTNGSTTITDSSSNNFAITAFNDAQISTTDPKFGTGAISFDGTGDYITIPANSAFQLGTGDFTVECWAKPSVTNDNDGLFTFGGSVTGLAVSVTSGSWLLHPAAGGGTTMVSAILNTWQHVAVTRSGTSLRFFLNGIQAGSTISNNTNFTDNQLKVGYYYANSFVYSGLIDEFRVTKGIARYTGNFTSPTAPFPDIASR